MKKRKKLGFFQKIILSITDFRIFPYVLKNETVAKSFAHFVCFILLLVAIVTFKYSADSFKNFEEFVQNYDENVPEFVLQDGTLSVEENEIIRINSGMAIAIDTNYSYESYKTSKEYDKVTKYDTRVLINSDIITYENYAGNRVSIFLSDISNDYNKGSFYEYITSIYNDPINRVLIVVIIYSTIFLVYGLSKFVDLLIFMLFVYMICLMNRMKMDSRNYLKIAIYAVTLPYIVETISIVYTGVIIKDYALFISNLLAYVYIIYGVRAIKLDAFLLIINNSKKVKNGSKPNSVVVDLNDNEKDETKDDAEDKEQEDTKDDNESQDK